MNILDPLVALCWYLRNPNRSIVVMKNFDYRSVDGQLLNVFLILLEESSVTKAAERLNVTQSSVSHSLARLRVFFSDPLFVRSGQMFLATERALSLKNPVQAVLDGMKELTHERPFDPSDEELFFIIAANDMQRDLIFPQLIRDLDHEGISVAFEFIPSGHPTVSLMRDARCHLALTPFPPDASDIMQKKLFEASMMCFFDSDFREPPSTREEYLEAEHVTVRFPDGGTSRRALTGVDLTGMSDARISVPNFNAILPFVKGTRRIATEMDLMKLNALKGLDMAPMPMSADQVSIFLTWHRRSTRDPSHVWLRRRIEKLSSMTISSRT